jgi:hypothetical protein
MADWKTFANEAPDIAGLFESRLAASGLAMLGTTRADGFPRVSPVEIAVRGGELWLGMMPGATKARDLVRDGRCCLHTATVDTHVSEGDAKVFAVATKAEDPVQLQAWLDSLGDDDYKPELGSFDLFALDLVGASSLRVADDALRIEVWHPGEPVRVEIKR